MSSGDTLRQVPRRYYNVTKMRTHDYLYDSAYIVSGAKDYARTAFKAAMASAQVTIQPVYNAMFSELREFPRVQFVYYANCRLPEHMDRSYHAYLRRTQATHAQPAPDMGGRDQFKFVNVPRKVLPLSRISPRFRPPSPARAPERPVNRGVQTMYRESSAQTHPWQPDGKAADGCENTPEVLYLDKLEWGPGTPYRTGDLPADFHTTEIINKMRHARTWSELVEKGVFTRWMKKRDAIIGDVETKDWIFREAEIDELQDIRLALLHKLQEDLREKKTTRAGRKLQKLWDLKKTAMERKIDGIRRTRDRELRKLSALHSGGGRMGLVAQMRAARGLGPATVAAHDPASDARAPVARHGYQARKRHAEICYDPTLLELEDHEALARPPAWLDRCGQDLTKSCSGHHLKRDGIALCERETRWSEEFLKNLHEELKKARLGAAAMTAGPLRVLKPRRVVITPRPETPEVEGVNEDEEASHQAALLLQRMLRGRAVQNLMYEGRTRAAELTEELKTTHGLQKEDQLVIDKEEARARDYDAVRTEVEKKEDAISALVDELCGGAVSAALDFLEKELRRLREERRQHAFILIAVREKNMREAAEAGRRQKEEHRRREHDEMFKQVLGVTQETVDEYLRGAAAAGAALCAEEEAAARAGAAAERAQAALREHGSMSTAEQNELVAELVQQLLLPEAQRCSARLRVGAVQAAGLEAARGEVFGLLDEAEVKEETCTRCGAELDERCRCRRCSLAQQPVEKPALRADPRWKTTRRPPAAPPKTLEERYPPQHEFRCMLNTLLDEVVVSSRQHCAELREVSRELRDELRERMEVVLDARDYVDDVVDIATGARQLPVKRLEYRHVMMRRVGDALERSEPFRGKPCAAELPSESRRRADAAAALADPTCRCEPEDAATGSKTRFGYNLLTEEEKAQMLPSELRVLEEMRRCKCDAGPTPSPQDPTVVDEMEPEWTETTASPSPRPEPEE